MNPMISPNLLAAASLGCAAGPAILFVRNLARYLPPPPATGPPPTVSVLIPARDEEASIVAAVESVLRSTGVALEVVVMDDASTDHTAALVLDLARQDPRVRLEHAPPLPPGWNGKQHACWTLAATARHDLLCFLDADVRLAPEALARMAAFLAAGDNAPVSNALVSGFPRQLTETWLEWMLLPLIHFVLLGFLPLGLMRGGTDPGFAAGCGQFLLVRREAYQAAGGHAAIRATMHDGLLLPRALRAAGFRTDLADLTPYATCRMYTDAAQVWRGLAKNATEGIAHPTRIVPISLLLVLGQVVPFLLVPSLPHLGHLAAACTVLAVTAAWLPRMLGVARFRQSLAGAILHPLGIALLLAVQWYALIRQLTGSPVSWKTRAYTPSS